MDKALRTSQNRVLKFLSKKYKLIFLAILLALMFFIVIFVPQEAEPEPLDEQCLAERLCWENNYEFYYMDIDGFLTSNKLVKCYETTGKGDRLLHEFIKINWTALDERYACN